MLKMTDTPSNDEEISNESTEYDPSTQEDEESELDKKKATPKRAPRFTYIENEALIDGVLTNYKTLFGKLGGQQYCFERKEKIWKKIAQLVSSVGKVPRSAYVCKKRYSDCKIAVKKKMSMMHLHAKKTGGGSCLKIDMCPWEQRLSEKLSLNAVRGIEESIDTEAPVSPPKAFGKKKTQKQSKKFVKTTESMKSYSAKSLLKAKKIVHKNQNMDVSHSSKVKTSSTNIRYDLDKSENASNLLTETLEIRDSSACDSENSQEGKPECSTSINKGRRYEGLKNMTSKSQIKATGVFPINDNINNLIESALNVNKNVVNQEFEILHKDSTEIIRVISELGKEICKNQETMIYYLETISEKLKATKNPDVEHVPSYQEQMENEDENDQFPTGQDEDSNYLNSEIPESGHLKQQEIGDMAQIVRPKRLFKRPRNFFDNED
ncbi:uncharacterized protein LOC134929408 [Pseudophryne corroboree]|uniref:uncharacterized protein LOC134929408 n=1 Tax=Pseudophryne corroboree TaxID=495146 RepID=UPI0030821B63